MRPVSKRALWRQPGVERLQRTHGGAATFHAYCRNLTLERDRFARGIGFDRSIFMGGMPDWHKEL